MIKYCYIHIPFCKNICSYCDFSKLYYKEELVDKYLTALEKEINNKYQNEILETIYIGGGTPSSLNINQLERLFKILERFKKSKNIEYTIEGNIESTTIDKLKLYKKYGINRLSFGIETINKQNLKFLNRKVDTTQVNNLISFARILGFNNINLDLMYALPTENINILKQDLKYILSLDVEHISTYSLIIEEHTKLNIKKIETINEDLDYQMYKLICNEMHKNNYEHYEISNFAKKKYYSKHNLCYWNNEEYYGFGLGASSYYDKKRINNTRSIDKYLKNNFIVSTEYLDKKAIIEYEIILNLRKKKGINLKEFYKKYNIYLEEIYNYKELLINNLLIQDKNYLFIPEDKWYISNEILIKILESVK